MLSISASKDPKVRWETSVAVNALLSIDSIRLNSAATAHASSATDQLALRSSSDKEGRRIATNEVFILASSMDGRVHFLDGCAGNLLASTQVSLLHTQSPLACIRSSTSSARDRTCGRL